MISSVNFRGSETTGSVADRRIESAKQETTGGVGARKNQDSIFTVDNEPKQDTVCFRGTEYGEHQKKSSAGPLFLGTLALTAGTIGLLGLAHRNGWINNIGNENIKKYIDMVAEPCHDACKWLKNNSYDKVVEFFNKK